ncbi:hypothetical protein MMSR116_29480 [Methylobacterium mesophilicum SR1.6/6]|uniref:Uncharacterized protein n=1 Tax=Methylobacterium mesophilicum SR1.6/6 TaxID=908290 RepID=A0A6B9FUM0_9HYPH|nr:hypothetical protein [Methylobacterium mesophilicum]QGY05569.1 hypothetical protein MMSR116_29480 [Methylobacterium mesophilicum SR1.6/6]
MGSLRSLLDQASSYAEALFDPDDVIRSHFVAEAADGSLTVAVLDMGGADLDHMRKAMALKFEREGFRRWVFFSEGWMVEPSDHRRRGDPQDDPERVEVILFDAFDVGGNRRVRARRQILRTDVAAARVMPLVISQGPVVYYPTRHSRVGA